MGVSSIFPVCLVSEWMPFGSIRSYLSQHPQEDRVKYVSDLSYFLLIHMDGHRPYGLINTSPPEYHRLRPPQSADCGSYLHLFGSQ
jgi:hypothetical protein